MPYKFSMQNLGSYLRVNVHGHRIPGSEVKDSTEVWLATARKYKEDNTFRVLIVWHVTGKFPVVGAYEMWSKPEQFGWDRRIKVAAVFPDQESRGGNRFTEDVAVNRGVFGRICDSEGDALKWLLDD